MPEEMEGIAVFRQRLEGIRPRLARVARRLVAAISQAQVAGLSKVEITEYLGEVLADTLGANDELANSVAGSLVEQVSDSEIDSEIKKLIDLRNRKEVVEKNLAHSVSHALRSGHSWAEVGTALGVPEPVARYRYRYRDATSEDAEDELHQDDTLKELRDLRAIQLTVTDETKQAVVAARESKLFWDDIASALGVPRTVAWNRGSGRTSPRKSKETDEIGF